MAVSLIAALALTLQAAAVPPQAEPTTVEELTVTGVKPSTAAAVIRDFAAPTDRGRLARWDRRICPATLGLPAAYGQVLNDRIAQTAADIGLDVGDAGCRPNVLVLVTSEAGRAAERLAAQEQKMLALVSDRQQRLSGGGSQSIGEFVRSQQPVRWWHVSEEVAADGRTTDGGRQESYFASRLKRSTREDFARVILIVDTTKLKGVTYDALGAYLAMASLAQLDPEAKVESTDTVMSIFADRDAGRPVGAGLTRWDSAYLTGLYSAPRDARTASSQRGAIQREMEREAAKPEAPAN